MVPSRRVLRTLLVSLACLALAAGCSTTQKKEAPPPQVPPEIRLTPPPGVGLRDAGTFVTPPYLEGRPLVRVGLLLPLGANQPGVRNIAASMQRAAELAMFEFGRPDVVILPHDTGGTAEGAAAAAEAVIADGADIILGPLFAESVRAVGPIARAQNVPVIAFSTDRSVAGDDVYLLSFLPEQEVERVTDFAVLQGYQIFAALIPDTDYGSRVRFAYAQALAARNAELYGMEGYVPIAEEMFAPARRLAEYDTRQAALETERANLRAAGDAASLAMLEDLKEAETLGDVTYEAVLIPEGGAKLQSLAPLMPYFDVDPRKVKFLGTGLWDDPTLLREPSLIGGWFAATSPSARVSFVDRYISLFGDEPPRLASLAYDSMSLAIALSDPKGNPRFDGTRLTNPDGFTGTDGIFRFQEDGLVERGLAVMEVHPSGFRVVSPAPTSFAPEVVF